MRYNFIPMILNGARDMSDCREPDRMRPSHAGEWWQGLLTGVLGLVLSIVTPSGIGGTCIGEVLFRMASLLLEGGGDAPGFWRELGAAGLSPPTGFNRLVFGDRFAAVFPSRNPAIFTRLRFGATLTTNATNAGVSNDVIRQEGRADFSMTYGLP